MTLKHESVTHDLDLCRGSQQGRVWPLAPPVLKVIRTFQVLVIFPCLRSLTAALSVLKHAQSSSEWAQTCSEQFRVCSNMLRVAPSLTCEVSGVKSHIDISGFFVFPCLRPLRVAPSVLKHAPSSSEFAQTCSEQLRVCSNVLRAAPSVLKHAQSRDSYQPITLWLCLSHSYMRRRSCVHPH